MQVFKCSIDGIELIKDTFDKLPKVIIKNDEVTVYSKNQNECKELYIKNTNKIIIKNLNKSVKLQQSINALQ